MALAPPAGCLPSVACSFMVKVCGKIHLILLAALLAGRLVTLPRPSVSQKAQRVKLAKRITSEPEVQKLFSPNYSARPMPASTIRADPSLTSALREARRRSLKEHSRASLEDMKKALRTGLRLRAPRPIARTACGAANHPELGPSHQPTGVPIDETKLEPLFGRL